MGKSMARISASSSIFQSRPLTANSLNCSVSFAVNRL